MLFPPRGADRKPMKVSEEIMAARLANPVWIAETRICKRRSLEVWQLSESAVGWRMSCGWYRSKTDAIEDRRERGALREGMRSGFTLGQYLMLVEYTGRMLREGKAAISSEVADIFGRLGCTPETWGVRMSKLTGGRMLGRFLAASRERLRQLASKLNVRHLANVG